MELHSNHWRSDGARSPVIHNATTHNDNPSLRHDKSACRERSEESEAQRTAPTAAESASTPRRRSSSRSAGSSMPTERRIRPSGRAKPPAAAHPLQGGDRGGGVLGAGTPPRHDIRVS